MSAKGRRTVGREGYLDYIRSAEWKAVKTRYLKSKLPKNCLVCKAPWSNSFHFHHRTYKNLGREFLRDLVVVCGKCHDLIHEYQKATVDAGTRLS